MKKNMGAADRSIRIVVALIVIALYLTHRINGVVAIVLGIIAAAFLLTSVMGWCPGYIPLKFSTNKRPGGEKPAA
ncbi:MAG TPA: DUF2892 domain-containing protein [Candidatus Krumholzibacteria bacterium]|nr:DUF2892 domain-containing protein [Candidatus Krumholzibacteria bacterium]